MSPERLKVLQDRAHMLRRAREFFHDRQILEVDCGALVQRAPIDSNIDVISALVTEKQQGYLHTSPEYAMKRLLSEGIGDIFFLGHVYRKGEIGRLHNPEFTMAEWYRIDVSFEDFIKETTSFIFLFIPEVPLRVIGYRDLFYQYVGIDYSKDSLDHLAPSHWNRTEKLHYILSHLIEPKLGSRELTIVIDYPPYEAALAKVIEKQGELVAKRFEIYYKGVELANGYHELSDAKELKRRFELENEERTKRGQEVYTLDEDFLSAIERGLPDCCGVSVGFDRVLMLRHKATSLSEVLPFAWKS